MTKAEACLWKFALRARQMQGYQFRRQRPVGKFIADFMCKELMLVIEVDGSSHNWDETGERDRIKDSTLAEMGFVVLRVRNEEVLHNLEGVKDLIGREIERIVETKPRS
jgi:very-short-patch-repair endonuclease